MNGIYDLNSAACGAPGFISQQRKVAKPLHLQQLENALDMRPFMRYARDILSRPLSESEDNDGADEENNFMVGGEDQESDAADSNPGHRPAKKTRRKPSKAKLGTKEGISRIFSEYALIPSILHCT